MWALIKAGLGVATGGASGVVGWLLSNWKLVLGALAVLGTAIAIGVLVVERDAARAQAAKAAATIATLTAQKDALQGNVNDLTGQLNTQNKEIEGWKATMTAMQAAAASAMQAAKEQTAKNSATIAALRARGADKSNTGSCDAEIARIRAGL